MGASQRVRFTTQRLEKLVCPAGLDRVYIHDTDVKGLCVSVLASGSKVFFVYKRIAGRPTRLRLGEFPAMSVDDARKAAKKAIVGIEGGANPHAERLQARAETTFRELFDKHIEHAKGHNKTWRENQRQFNKYLGKLANRRLSEISRADVERLHATMGRENGKFIANRTLALVHHVFAKTAPKHGYDGPNPAHGIEKFREQSRDRFLTADELPKFLEAVELEDAIFRDYFLLSLLTGARRANLAAMRWQDVNLDTSVWRIPPEHAKSGETILVPLVPEAVDILRRRQAESTGSPFVFPSHGKRGHLVEPKKSWKRILERAGLADLRLHDLRRTFGSWQAAAGVSLNIIGKSMGHRNQSTTAIYARLALDPVREGVTAGTSMMMAAARAKPTDTKEGGTE